MEFIPDFFKKAPLGTFEESVCSPKAPSSTWSGVIIQAPQRILLEPGETPSVPICGYYLVPAVAAMDGPPFAVHVRPVDSDSVYTGKVIEEGENEPEDPPPPEAPRHSREDLEGVSIGGHFNIDAQRYLRKRLDPGSYEATVTYAGAVSNKVLIEITMP